MKRTTKFKLLFLFALIYFLWPRDLIPDAFGLFGRIDDLLLVGYIYYRFRRVQKVFNKVEESAPESAKRAPLDAYEVLGVSRTATREDIRAAYVKLAHQYHPDRVSHLGQDLKELAHEKMLSIQRAYEELSAR